ncbi:hypothetical protein GGX14DRAFT_570611 [Mycena pura]|uniref:Uncharacterized protein n=1 Tax=Mycena pura TaxID=153505 RepID=A0AAD6V8K7_9AGAR|nr:hypothetical protein GGX14DRAFT_570611 [Mycena pura]
MAPSKRTHGKKTTAKPASKSGAAGKTKKGKMPDAVPKQKPRTLREIEDEEEDELKDDGSLPGEDRGVEEENADEEENLNAEDLGQGDELEPPPRGTPIPTPPPADSLSRAGAAHRTPTPSPPPDSPSRAGGAHGPAASPHAGRTPSAPSRWVAASAHSLSPPPDTQRGGADGARISPAPPAESLSRATTTRRTPIPTPPPASSSVAGSPHIPSPPPDTLSREQTPLPDELPPPPPPPVPPHWVAVEKARQRAEELHAGVQGLEAEEERIMRLTRDAMGAARHADASEEAQEAAAVLLREVREAAARVNDARDQAFAAQAWWRSLEKEAKEKDAAPPPLSAEEQAARDANAKEVQRSLIYGSQDDDDDDDDEEGGDGEYDSDTHQSRNPELPKQPKASRTRPGKLDPVAAADREAKSKGRRQENKEIDKRIRENEEERQKLCMEIATQYHRKPDNIRARFPDRYGRVKQRRKVSLHNALKHEISKVWAEQGRFLNKDYALADLAAEAKKPEWITVGRERGEELMAALQTLHDEEDFGTRATNNGAAADVNNAFNSCVNILKGVKARTGAIGMVIIARVHVNDNNEPKIFGSGKALDFLKDGAAQFAQDFEMWAVKEKKGRNSNCCRPVHGSPRDIRKRYRDLMETALKKVTDKPINYKDYIGKMMLQNGVYIKGWPFDTVYSLSSHKEMETVVQGLEDGSITWSRIPAPEKPRVQKWVKWMEKRGKWHGPSRKARADKRGEQAARDDGSTPGHSPIYPAFMSKKVRALALAAGTLYDMDEDSGGNSSNEADDSEDTAPQPKSKVKAAKRKERGVDEEEEEADESRPKSKAEAARALRKRKEREVEEEEAEEPTKKRKDGKHVKFTKSAVKVGPPRGILKNASAGPSKVSSTKKRRRTESSDSDESHPELQDDSDSDEARPPKRNKASDRAQPRQPPPHPVTGHARRALPFSAVPKGKRKGKK